MGIHAWGTTMVVAREVIENEGIYFNVARGVLPSGCTRVHRVSINGIYLKDPPEHTGYAKGGECAYRKCQQAGGTRAGEMLQKETRSKTHGCQICW